MLTVLICSSARIKWKWLEKNTIPVWGSLVTQFKSLLQDTLSYCLEFTEFCLFENKPTKNGGTRLYIFSYSHRTLLDKGNYIGKKMLESVSVPFVMLVLLVLHIL